MRRLNILHLVLLIGKHFNADASPLLFSSNPFNGQTSYILTWAASEKPSIMIFFLANYHMPCLHPCSWRSSSPVSFSWWTFLQTFSTSSQTTQPVETFLSSISLLVVSSMSIYVIKKESEKLVIATPNSDS